VTGSVSGTGRLAVYPGEDAW